MALPSQRHLFDIPRDVCYLNAAYMTPLSHAVRAAGETAFDARAVPWTVSPEDFFTGPEELRGLFARLINASADDIALVPAVSYGLATAAVNIRLEPGQTILVLAEQFPSNVYAWRRMAEEQGATLVTVADPPDGDHSGALLAAMEEQGERLGLVACPHYHWATGAAVDIKAVGGRCRAVGAAFVLDVTQSLGAAPLDVAEADPDFIACAGYKWLFGPYGLAYLYVAPRHQNGRPLEENWIARLGAEDFTRLVDYEDAYAPGARRFDMGERSSFFLVPMATAALTQILDWGVANIADTLAAMNDRIAGVFAPLGFKPRARRLRGPHLMGLECDGAVDNALIEALRANKIFVSVRGNSVRSAPHVYVDDHDLDRLAAVIGRLDRN